MTDNNIGRFVWYDLHTADPRAAIAFYTHVVGWTTQPWENDYTLLVGANGPLGGVMKLPDEAKKRGARALWTANVLVNDVDATVGQARKLGGAIHVDARDIPKVGRFAVTADPQGATVNVFKPINPMKPHDPTKPGEFTWHELVTTDHEAAFRFYSTLFGWEKLRDFDMGAMGNYLIYGLRGTELGGMFTKSKDMPAPPMFLYYIHVGDLDAALARAKDKAARVINGPMEVPGGARIVQLADAQGVMFALHEAAK